MDVKGGCDTMSQGTIVAGITRNHSEPDKMAAL
jgi:hypothetical protein